MGKDTIHIAKAVAPSASLAWHRRPVGGAVAVAVDGCWRANGDVAAVAVASRRRRVGVAAAWPSRDMVAGAWRWRLAGVTTPAMAAW